MALMALPGCSSPVKLSEIAIFHPELPIGCGQDATFSAIGYDKNMIIVPLQDNLTWTSSPASGVTITADQAGQSAEISFSDAGSYTIRAAAGQIFKEVLIEVTCSELARIEVLPASRDLKLGESQVFTVNGYDQFDDLIAITEQIAWSVTGNIGTISSSSGVSTTFTSTALGEGTVNADVGGLSDFSAIEVIPASELTTISILPVFGTTLIGTCTFLTATAFDQYGDVMVLSCTPVWIIGGGIGTASPASGWSTTFCAAATGSGTISITCGSITQTFAVNVLAGG